MNAITVTVCTATNTPMTTSENPAVAHKPQGLGVNSASEFRAASSIRAIAVTARWVERSEPHHVLRKLVWWGSFCSTHLRFHDKNYFLLFAVKPGQLSVRNGQTGNPSSL
jgi:hypothetical protein